MFVESSYRIYLIHGYAGPGFEMKKILKALEKEGYNCTLFTYRSMVDDIDSVGMDLIKRIQSDRVDRISFVTHSMGALVVRSIFEHIVLYKDFPSIERIVMIAPPNNGTPIADFYSKFPFLKFILGPNLNNLTTDPISGAGRYPIPPCEIGLVTGSFQGSKILSLFIRSDNDGVVAREQAKLGVEKDNVNIKSWHFGLLYNKRVVKYVISFIQNGRFTLEK